MLSAVLILCMIGVVCFLETSCTLMLRVLFDELGGKVIVHLAPVGGLFQIHFEYPERTRRKKRKSRIDKKRLLRAVRREIDRQNLLKKLKIHLRLRAKIGLGDAAKTAQTCAFAGALAHAGCAALKNRAESLQAQLDVEPDFRKTLLRLRFFCMIEGKTGNIMAVAVKLPMMLLGGKITDER